MIEASGDTRREEALECSPDYEVIASPWIGLHYRCEMVTCFVGATVTCTS